MDVADIGRLVHRAAILEMNGESYRKRSAVGRLDTPQTTTGNYTKNVASDRPS